MSVAPEGNEELGQAAGTVPADMMRQAGRPSTRVKSIGHYILMKTIGEGTFGKVKLGYHILTGERVAVKVLEKDRIVNVDDVERVAREIHILKLIRACRHIIQLYEIIETPHQLYLIMEYACGGELFDYIVQHGRAEEREACRFLHQILAGVERVHEMCVCHRDLKPENLLLDDRKDIKIVDFGLSNTYQDGQLLETACGSPCYAAPEMIAGKLYVPSMVDIWSCGVILFALVCGYLPFEDQNHTELYKKIRNAEYEMPNFVSNEVADLISGMLTTEPTKRMTLSDIRQHVWYRQIPEASLRDREDNGFLDEEILEQLDSYGFPREYAVKCLKTNKHNHVTTTYHLIREKRLRSKAEGSRATSEVIADLDATGVEDLCGLGQTTAAAAPAAVAAVATPSRGARAEAEAPNSGRCRQAGAGARSAWAEGGDGGLVWPGSNPGTAPPLNGSVPPVAEPPAPGVELGGHPGRPSRGAVPRLNLGDLAQVGRGAEHQGSLVANGCGAGGGCSGPPTHRGTAAGSRSPRGPRHSLQGHRGGCDARSASPSQPPMQHVPGRGMASPHPRQPRGGEPPSAALGTPRAAPLSARGGHGYHGHGDGYGGAPPAMPRRRPSAAEPGAGPRRACSPWGHGGYGGWPDPVSDMAFGGEFEASPWGRSGEAPLTARPRLQGNAGGCRERPIGTWGSGSGSSVPRSGGSAGRMGSSRPPQSARGGVHGVHNAHDGCDGLNDSGPGTFQVSCSSRQPPRQIVQELLRSLAAHGIAYRQVSNFMVRCQTQGLRFQAEVLQLDRGSGYALRVSRVSGDVWQYKDVCARLLSEMDL